MKVKGREINQGLIGTEVIITKVESSLKQYVSVGGRYPITGIDEEDDKFPFLVDGKDWIFLEEGGDDFEWADVESEKVKKTNKTQRKAIAKNLVFQVDKLNALLSESVDCGLTVELEWGFIEEGEDFIKFVEVSYQPDTPPKEDLL